MYADKILPVTEYNDYYVNLMDKTMPNIVAKNKTITRKSLPKINSLIEWGVVKPGDIIIAKGRDDEATLQTNGNVVAYGKEQSMAVWLRELYGWSTVQTYAFAIHKETGKTLSQMREEYMAKEIETATEV